MLVGLFLSECKSFLFLRTIYVHCVYLALKLKNNYKLQLKMAVTSVFAIGIEGVRFLVLITTLTVDLLPETGI
jgi:hypothetical protein